VLADLSVFVFSVRENEKSITFWQHGIDSPDLAFFPGKFLSVNHKARLAKKVVEMTNKGGRIRFEHAVLV
jgi:hypothetical protein